MNENPNQYLKGISMFNMNLLINETFPNATKGGLNNSLRNSTVSTQEQSSDCLPSWILDAIGVSSVYASDIVLTVLQIPSAIFAFLSNLAVIVTIIRTPSLHVPVNVLLCGLAAANCLKALVAQPVFVSWRFLLHHHGNPCSLVHLYQATKSLPLLTVGCAFLNLSISSVDRFCAVTKPFVYRAVVTFQGMVKIVVGAWIVWSIYVCLLETVVPTAKYQPIKNVTLASLLIIPVAGHVLTFLAIRNNSRKISHVAHDLQHVTLFKREKRAARDMAFYTAVTLLSVVPILTLLNSENDVITGSVLLPWAQTSTMLVSSIIPVIQIKRNAALKDALKNVFRSNMLVPV